MTDKHADQAETIAHLQADNAKLHEALEHTISLPVDGMYLFKVNKFYVEKVLGETK